MRVRWFKNSTCYAPAATTSQRIVVCEPLENRMLLAGNTGIQAFIPTPASRDDINKNTANTAGSGRQLARRAMSAAAATPNLTITGLFIVDANNTIANPVTGQMVFARATWNNSGIASGTRYIVRFAMDGVQIDSGTVTNNGDGSYYWYRGGWFAAPGSHTVTATIDGAGVIAESNEADNTTSRLFSPSTPTTLPAKMIQPIGKVRNGDWYINNYADVDPRSGVATDYLGGPYQYDGHDAIDAGPADFAAQDNGISVHAALAGTIVEVLDGNFDRETSMGSRPGNHVLIDHGNGWQTLYYHFSNNTITVKVGDIVTAGQVIGLMGSSGSSTSTHLHFTLIKGGAVVETGYDLASYLVDPPPYSGNAPSTVLDSWITNYNNLGEYGERESTVDTFTTASSATVYYASYSTNWKTTDNFTIQFLRPNGTIAQTANYTPAASYRLASLYWTLPYATWSTAVGLWTAVLIKNGQELNRRTFSVITGIGRPEAKLMQGTTPVLDGRTTPLYLGTVVSGATANTLSVTLSNHGSAPLAISSVQLPAGVQIVTPLPATLAVGASAVLAIRMDTSEIGPRSGEVAILSNDDDEARYSFNVSGSVTGTPTVAPEAFTTMSAPGVPFHVGTTAKLVDPTVTVATGSTTNYGSAVLHADLYGGGVTAGDVLQLMPGGDLSVDGNNVRLNGTIAGTLATAASGLTVTMAIGTLRADVQAVARRIAYSSTATTTGRRYVRLSITGPADVAIGAAVTKTIVYDNLPRPELTSVTDVFATGQGVKAVFSADISASLTAADVSLTNVATGLPVSAVTTITTDAATRTATLVFRTPANQPLPNGRYEVRLASTGVTNTIGLPLYENAVLPFFVLAGDANHNGMSNFDDFLVMQNHFNAIGNFAEGDFNYDGVINFDDFLILQNNFNTTV